MEKLTSYLKDNGIEFYLNFNTSNLVSISVGGCAKIVVYPKNIKELIDIVRLSEKSFVILGNGTNSFFTDSFLNKVVIVTSKINQVKIEHDIIIAKCGASINRCCMVAKENCLSGLEFSYGIPGTIGGAITMNASAFGCSFDKLVLESTAYDIENDIVVELSYNKHYFDIKNSIFRSNSFILLETKLKLNYDEMHSISKKMHENLVKRIETQPLNLPNSGSTFKRPMLGYASKLIDDAGLKGYTIGGAQISTKHAGFIVNIGNATANDVLCLISYVKKVIKEKYNILLEEEVVFIDR